MFWFSVNLLLSTSFMVTKYSYI